jgi:arabinan endo-1,5-alpha-L-arabinosidase
LEFPIALAQLNVDNPCILADRQSRRYYLYSRVFACGLTPRERPGTGSTFYAVCSEDLLHWSDPILVFEQDDFWASEAYHAPEVHFWQGRYYLIATFSAPGRLRRCQALVADSPLGPFRPIHQEPLTPPAWSCQDGTLFVDRDGQPWLIFCHDWVQVYDGQICALPLTDDLGAAAGCAAILFRASDAAWTDDPVYTIGDGGGVTCGPWLHPLADGSLALLWSGGSPRGFAVGLARSPTGDIAGPWLQSPVPFFDPASQSGGAGTNRPAAACSGDGGHVSLFRRLDDDRLILALATRTGRGPDVRTRLFELSEQPDNLAIVSEIQE